MIREDLDYTTMYNKQNTMVKTTLQPVVTPVGFLTIIPTKVSFRALKLLDSLSKNKDYVSYSQNLSEVSRKYYVLIILSMRTHQNEYLVLTTTSTCTY